MEKEKENGKKNGEGERKKVRGMRREGKEAGKGKVEGRQLKKCRTH